ncbi:DUF6406 domain-containing protein [Streptomyces sp. NPDC047023]|uniref:DUF6406 domain-containing protein n=1 Tax=Streptomyces sp. NPDC047023 TaxID=3155139 RepID=UPI0034117381
MDREIVLQHAAPWVRGDVTFVAIHIYAPAGGPITVTLGVDADQEMDYDLTIGDTFSVRGETWVLDRVEGHLSRDYRVFLRQVE